MSNFKQSPNFEKKFMTQIVTEMIFPILMSSSVHSILLDFLMV